jgi:hypothetical protein
VVAVSRWELHSSFWMSLHQRLIEDAMAREPRPLDALTPAEKAAWQEAVEAYRTLGGDGNMTFARPMIITSDALSQVVDDATELVGDAPLSEALSRAAPVYRAHRWPADDRAARFFINYAAGLLRGAGDTLVGQHEAAYGTPWPGRIRLYVTPAAGPYGAYTFHGLAGGLITTLSCRDEGYQGLHALEMILHESSHGPIGPNKGPVAEAIKTTAQSLDAPVPRDLWHAILFATSSELTRRHLADLGIAGFVPSSVDMFTRVWPELREPVADHWISYLEGRGTLEDAIAAILREVHDD